VVFNARGGAKLGSTWEIWESREERAMARRIDWYYHRKG